MSNGSTSYLFCKVDESKPPASRFLWIGFFAALVGSALFVGYRTGLTWRGWTVHPAELVDDAVSLPDR